MPLSQMELGWKWIWVQKKRIVTIQFITRNDDNGLTTNKLYKLMYMDLNGWASAEVQIAKADSLIYIKFQAMRLICSKSD